MLFFSRPLARIFLQGPVLGLFLHGVVYHKVHGRLGFLPCKSAPPSRGRFRVSCSVENYA